MTVRPSAEGSSDAPVRVLVVEDDPEMIELVARVLREEGYAVLTARDGHQALRLLDEGEFDVLVTDVRIPGPDGLAVLRHAMSQRLEQPVILMTAFGSISAAVEAMREGAFHYLAKPFDLEELLEVVGTAADQIHDLRTFRGACPGETDQLFGIVSSSATMARLLTMAREVAASNATVLLQGASGTGKELLARAIHATSPRRTAPFVPLDCGAIPETLLESELFGCRRGAFTGAVEDRGGIVEQAGRGTLFMDEVANLSLPLQAKLLRFLQERRYRRVGEAHERSVDVRLVSATNRDLAELVADGTFRDDLYYRLSVITLTLPPLKDRREDIPALAYHTIRKLNAASSYRVEGVRREAMDLLVDYPWPGNVRQLENVLERAVILRKAGLIQAAGLPDEISRGSASEPARTLDEIERQHVLELLERFGGNRSRVARALGISRRTVHRKLRAWGLADDEE